MSADDEDPSDDVPGDDTPEEEGVPEDVSEDGDESTVDDEDLPDFAKYKDIDKDVPIERKNTLQRIRQDYDEPAKGTVREAVQNGVDAWGRNMDRGILPTDTQLKIVFQIDTERKTFTYTDNAGGMTEEVLQNNLVGIDTPDEDKEAGLGAGAYGRGFYVIAMCGNGLTYVETRQGHEHNAMTVSNDGKYSDPATPENPRLPSEHQGTYIFVDDVVEHDFDFLGDWEQVQEMFVQNFSFLLNRDDVTVQYLIDGEKHEPVAPNLEKYLENGQLMYRRELPEFNAEGDTYRVRDLYVIRTDVMEEEPPWEGVAMLKGNQYLDKPFMTIKTYKPNGIPSIKTPPEMIGWCDATELCPDLENNAHTSFRGHESKTGIKDPLLQLHNEYFKKGRTTQEKEKLASEITRNINELLADYEDFDDYQVEGDITSETDEEGETDEPDLEPPGLSLIKCQAGKRQYDVGDRIPLKIEVNNPADAESERYALYDIKVSSSDLSMNKAVGSRVVDIAENDHETYDIVEFQPQSEGIYSFSASIRAQPELLIETGEQDEEPEELDTSKIYFTVGDVERSTRTPDDGPDGDGDDDDDGGEGEELGEVSVVQTTNFATEEGDDWKAVALDHEDGGFEVLVNMMRPEWLAADRIRDDEDRRDGIQLRLGVEWGIEQIVLRRNIDDLHDLLDQDTTIDGQPAAEYIQRLLEERDDLQSHIETKIADRFGLEYGS